MNKISTLTVYKPIQTQQQHIWQRLQFEAAEERKNIFCSTFFHSVRRFNAFIIRLSVYSSRRFSCQTAAELKGKYFFVCCSQGKFLVVKSRDEKYLIFFIGSELNFLFKKIDFVGKKFEISKSLKNLKM